MAVIDTSMDMPESCEYCPYIDKNDEFAHAFCTKTKKSFLRFLYENQRHDDCPLKEVNDKPSGKWICKEGQNITGWGG